MAIAQTQEKLNKIGASVDGAKGNLSAFDKMEDKINKKLDEANAMAELNSPKKEDNIEDLMSKYDNKNSSIEDELAALKGSSSAIENELDKLKENKQ